MFTGYTAVIVLKYLLTSAFLLRACIMDLKERRVPNRLWKYMVIVLFPLEVFEFLNYGFFDLIFGVIQFVLVFALAYGLYYIGAYGGADAKALMVLSFLFPVYPVLRVGSVTVPYLNTGFGVFAFSILSNSVIVAPALVLVLFLRNLIKEGIKNLRGNIFYYFIGYRVDVDAIPRFHNLLEYIDVRGKIVRLRRGIEPDEAILYRLKKAHEKGKISKVWVTPGLPFLIFITAGFFIAIFLGNLLFELISIFLSLF